MSRMTTRYVLKLGSCLEAAPELLVMSPEDEATRLGAFSCTVVYSVIYGTNRSPSYCTATGLVQGLYSHAWLTTSTNKEQHQNGAHTRTQYRDRLPFRDGSSDVVPDTHSQGMLKKNDDDKCIEKYVRFPD
jgi:hypothetical protein